MTIKDIEKEQARRNVPFELAKKIRAMLDEARETVGPSWDDDEMENEVFELLNE